MNLWYTVQWSKLEVPIYHTDHKDSYFSSKWLQYNKCLVRIKTKLVKSLVFPAFAQNISSSCKVNILQRVVFVLSIEKWSILYRL